MSVAQLESAILALPLDQRQQLLDWLDEHRRELVPPPAQESDAVKQELLRRRQEYVEHPEQFMVMRDADWDQLGRDIDEELRQTAPARRR